MTKLKKKYEISVYVEKENGRLQEIADIVTRYYAEASIKASLWQATPVSLIVVTSDEKTLRKMMDSLHEELKLDVDFRVAPYYLYD